jgi:hypothetical protein
MGVMELKRAVLLSVALLFLALLAVISGCGSGDSSSGDTGSGTGTVDSTGKARIVEFSQPG